MSEPARDLHKTSGKTTSPKNARLDGFFFTEPYGVFAKCWFPKAVEIRVLPGARLLANSFLTCPLLKKKLGGLIASAFSLKLFLV